MLNLFVDIPQPPTNGEWGGIHISPIGELLLDITIQLAKK